MPFAQLGHQSVSPQENSKHVYQFTFAIYFEWVSTIVHFVISLSFFKSSVLLYINYDQHSQISENLNYMYASARTIFQHYLKLQVALCSDPKDPIINSHEARPLSSSIISILFIQLFSLGEGTSIGTLWAVRNKHHLKPQVSLSPADHFCSFKQTIPIHDLSELCCFISHLN